MFIPKAVLLYFGKKSALLDFARIRKIFLIFAASWSILIFSGAIAKLGVALLVEQGSVNALRAEYEQKMLEAEELKLRYNNLAVDYLEKQKIARIIGSVNQWLNDDQVDLWVESLEENSCGIYENLNHFSRDKLSLNTTRYSVRDGVALLLSIAALESDFKLNALSHKGAYGPMQLKKSTAMQVGLIDHRDPVENISGGAAYLKYMLDKYYDYPDQLELALASYNAGATRVKKEWISTWGNEWDLIHEGLTTGKRFKETRKYVSTIIAMSRLFTSGKWSDLDEQFWSNYRRYIFQPKFASIYDYNRAPESVSVMEVEGS